MEHIVIRDVDGAVLHEGRARTRKAFVQELVLAGRSLARADLADADLSNLNLEGADFGGADLTGARLRGAFADGASFAGADMRGVVAPGLTARRANFSGARLDRHPSTGEASALDGAVLSYARFDGADLSHADLGGAGLSSTTMVGARLVATSLRDTTLHNVDWSSARVVGCDLENADMTPTIRVDERHLPDRTAGATVVGNNLKGSRLGVGNGAFAVDRIVGSASRAATFASVSASLFVAGLYVPFDADVDMLKEVMGSGLGFLAVAGAVSVLKERIGDGIKDRVSDWMREANVRARAAVLSLVRAGEAAADLSVGFVSSGHAGAVAAALRRSAGEGPMRWARAAAGGMDVVVCRKRTLARALSLLSDAIEGRGALERDLLVVRPGEGDAETPRAMLLMADGSVRAYWDYPWGAPPHAEWDAAGALVGFEGNRERLGRWGSLQEAMRSFIRGAVWQAGTQDTCADLATHRFRSGVDGSVVVVRKSDARLDNPYGPAIVTPSGEAIEYRNGRKVGPDAEAAAETRSLSFA